MAILPFIAIPQNLPLPPCTVVPQAEPHTARPHARTHACAQEEKGHLAGNGDTRSRVLA